MEFSGFCGVLWRLEVMAGNKKMIDKFRFLEYDQDTRLRTYLLFIGKFIPLSKNEDMKTKET